MEKSRDGLLKPILPNLNYSRENEKATPDEIFVERLHRAQLAILAEELAEEARALGFKVFEPKDSPNDGQP